MECVKVMLSTYNGEKFIEEQIRSIILQEKVYVELYIRDDGSIDDTLKIIKQLQNEFNNIHLLVGENQGACKSFFTLVDKIELTTEYYAFSDQDDVWKKDKLYRAINMIQKYKKYPTLYCGNYELVDEQLMKMNTDIYHMKKPSFGNALIECIYSGCTGVMNKALMKLVQTKIPKYAYMHDWWMYMVASAFGKVVYDRESYVLYRQHENNVIGATTNEKKRWTKRVENLNDLKNYVPKQVEEFRKLYYKEISGEQEKLINHIISKEKNVIKRLSIFGCKEIYRNNKTDNFLYKLYYLTWRL